MHYGNIKYNAVEDGEGCRTVLFVSGCRNMCPGCFQKQTWDFEYGQEFDHDAKQAIMDSLSGPYVSGLTLLGGEPFEPENQRDLLPFVRDVRTAHPEKTVWAYSGYTFEELTDPEHHAHTDDTMPLLELIDVLVDGKFVQELHSAMLPYRGSSNQRIIDVPASLRAGHPVLSPHNQRHGRDMSVGIGNAAPRHNSAYDPSRGYQPWKPAAERKETPGGRTGTETKASHDHRPETPSGQS